MTDPHSIRVAMCPALSHGGIAHYTYALAEALQAAGVDTKVLMYDEPEYDLVGYPHAHAIAADLQLATSRRRKLTSPVQNLAGALLASRGRGVAHFQWSLGKRNDRLVWRALHAAQKRIVYTAHDVLPHEPDIMSRQHCQWVYDRADAIIVHGEKLKATLLDNFTVSADKVRVIAHGNYNFVSDTPGSWQRDNARASFGFGASDRVVLFFGLIREYKGIDTLIDACREIARRGLPDGQRLRLLIGGRDFKNHWSEAGYQQRIADAGLADSVSLHMLHIPMPEVARFFHAADVVAIPYRRGSQSGVLQLTYSFGKAAVATRVGSLGEGPNRDVTRFVEPDSPAELADALYELLADAGAAQALGAKARRYAETELGWGPIAEATRAVYDSVR
ncbi:MAG TPA: glycosyltransferase family 4 protein [Polyangiaceae bacterium]|nr:glycosyltransferase family 4 protein [Polyangiaceae bacterium]